MKTLSMIVACIQAGQEKNQFGIGINGNLPWHLPKEFKFFVKHSKQKSEENPNGIISAPVIMGRKNFESLKKPLKDRTNIVLTRDPVWSPENFNEMDNVRIVHCPWKALAVAEKCPGKESMIIGGGEIYGLYAKLVRIQKLYISFIKAPHLEVDTFFPLEMFNISENYKKVFEESHGVDEKNIYSFTSRIYEHQ